MIVAKWPEVQFGEIADFRNGLNFTKENFGKGLKVIGVSDFQDYLIPKYDEISEINPEGVVKSDDLLREGDILFVRSNGNRSLIGRSLFLRGIEGQISHSAFTIRARIVSDKAIPRFYAYLFRTSLIRKTLSAQGGGTNISNLNQGILRELKVPLPPLPTQRKIAAILSAYDDLIENNTRRIKILEEMAQAIYREWFVHFRFPGHEGVRMVESEMGLIPEGWEVRHLIDFIEIDKGISYKGKYLTDDGLPMANLKCISINGGFLREGTKPYAGDYSSRHIVGPGDLIFANTDITQAGNIIGTPGIVPKKGFENGGLASHHISIVRLRKNIPITKIFLYHLLLSGGFREYAKGCSSGTTVLGFRASDALKFPFLLPPTHLIERFSKMAIESYEFEEFLKDKNEVIRRTRNLLLPKLISGELDVSELDIKIPEAMT